MAFPTIGSLSKNTPFSLLYHLYHFDTIDQRHPIECAQSATLVCLPVNLSSHPNMPLGHVVITISNCLTTVYFNNSDTLWLQKSSQIIVFFLCIPSKKHTICTTCFDNNIYTYCPQGVFTGRAILRITSNYFHT
jgi:hypothetical protein